MATPKADPTTNRPFGQKLARKNAFYLALVCLISLMISGLILRSYEIDQRHSTALQLAKAIADTALADPSLSLDETILKVSDLFLVDAVLGVKLIDGRTTPLSVGDTMENFPDLRRAEGEQLLWESGQPHLDVALKLPTSQSFDWFVVRLDSQKIMASAGLGSLVSLLIAPFCALVVFGAAFFMTGRFYGPPLEKLHRFFSQKEGRFYLNEMSEKDVQQPEPWGPLYQKIETARKDLRKETDLLKNQVGFLNETPFPLLRCSVNRKVLYANSSAKSLSPLFGDETAEFVSPALSEVVRKAFYDTKEIKTDIRIGEYVMTFRAVPVLDSGYVNLYGEQTRKFIPKA